MSNHAFRFGFLLLTAFVLAAPESALADVIGACVVQAGVVATRGATATNCDAGTAISEATNAADIAARDAGKGNCAAMTLATRRAICQAQGLTHRTDVSAYTTIIPANRGKFAVSASATGRCVAVKSGTAAVANSTSRCIFFFVDLGPQKRATVISQARCGVMCQ